jgi:hypothetical protein
MSGASGADQKPGHGRAHSVVRAEAPRAGKIRARNSLDAGGKNKGHDTEKQAGGNTEVRGQLPSAAHAAEDLTGRDENRARDRLPDRKDEAKTENQHQRSVPQKKTERENPDANFVREKSAPDSARRSEKIEIDRAFSRKYFRSGADAKPIFSLE